MCGSLISEEGERRIFAGQVLRVRGGRARVRGFHLEDETVKRERGIRVIEATRTAADSRGVYLAQIELGGALRKPAYGGFFPAGWTREQVRAAIAEAYSVRRPRGWVDAGHFFEGKTGEGMKIIMELDDGGRVIDAFPLRTKNPTHRKHDAQFRVMRGTQRKHHLVCTECHSIKIPVCPRGHNWPFRRRGLWQLWRQVRAVLRQLAPQWGMPPSWRGRR